MENETATSRNEAARLLDKLQSTFTSLIARNPKLPALAPAFFMHEMLTTVADDVAEPISERSPFDEFWMVYESSNAPFGTVTNIALCRDRDVRLWIITHALGQSLPLRFCVSFNLDDPDDFELGPGSLPRAVRETLPEMRLLLDRINNHERDESNHPALKRLNAARVARQMKKIAPFIVIKPERRVAQRSAAIGMGSPVSPHDRRGHPRHLRSGKTIWINPTTIKGGSKTARDYLVQ